MDIQGKRVLVVGLGKSGVSSALFLQSRGARVTVSDAKSEDQLRDEIPALLDRGIGVVSLHHNIGANPEWPEYHQVIGGAWLAGKRSIDGKEYGPSTFEHGQEIRIEIADEDHPITKGLVGFVIHDETYGNTYVSPSVHVLLRAENPKNVSPFAWVSQHGKSRVVYFQAGHDAEAWQHPGFQEILRRSIRWAAQHE